MSDILSRHLHRILNSLDSVYLHIHWILLAFKATKHTPSTWRVIQVIFYIHLTLLIKISFRMLIRITHQNVFCMVKHNDVVSLKALDIVAFIKHFSINFHSVTIHYMFTVMILKTFSYVIKLFSRLIWLHLHRKCLKPIFLLQINTIFR